MKCHVCKEKGATIPDPCCAAPDCEHFFDMAHFECLPSWRQEEELRWQQDRLDA